MIRDHRYSDARRLIETRSLTEFSHIFTYLPKTVLAQELKKNPSRMGYLIDHPDEMTYGEIKKISELFEVPCSEIIRLFDKDFL